MFGAGGYPTGDMRGWEATTSSLHDARLDAVLDHLLSSNVKSVLDLGCGSGALLRRLAGRQQFTRIVGVDRSLSALLLAEQLLVGEGGPLDGRIVLRHGSVTNADADLMDFDAAVLVETLEHLDPSELGRLEHSLFARLRPRLVIITTPNREYNAVHGLTDGQLRHRDHRFEWDRSRFGRWAAGVGSRNHYDVTIEGIGPASSWFGSSSQMALFAR